MARDVIIVASGDGPTTDIAAVPRASRCSRTFRGGSLASVETADTSFVNRACSFGTFVAFGAFGTRCRPRHLLIFTWRCGVGFGRRRAYLGC